MWRLYRSDFRDVIEEVMDQSDDPVIVTDPPFNVGYHYAGYSDRMDDGEYWQMLAGLRDYGPIVVVHYPEALHRLSVELGEAPRKVCSWVYNANTERQHRDVAFYGVTPDFNLVKRPYYSMRDKRCRALMERTGGARSYDWQYVDLVKNRSKEKTAHPCQMPLDVMRWVVGIIPGSGTIVDPFCGSGTTGVACVMAGRDFAGVEMSKEYYEIAERRLNEAKEEARFIQPKLF